MTCGGALIHDVDNVRRKQRILHSKECRGKGLADSSKYF